MWFNSFTDDAAKAQKEEILCPRQGSSPGISVQVQGVRALFVFLCCLPQIAPTEHLTMGRWILLPLLCPAWQSHAQPENLLLCSDLPGSSFLGFCKSQFSGLVPRPHHLLVAFVGTKAVYSCQCQAYRTHTKVGLLWRPEVHFLKLYLHSPL